MKSCFLKLKMAKIWLVAVSLISLLISQTNAANILFIVSDQSNLIGADSLAKNAMIGLGHTVTLKTGLASAASDTAGKNLIVISSTVNSADVAAKFLSVTKPVITWERALYPYMNMATGGGTVPGQTQITMNGAQSSHPLSAGLSGTVTVYSAGGLVGYGTGFGSGVTAIASVVGNPTQNVIFGYNAGAALTTGLAAGRRVGFMYQNTEFALNSANGTALFNAAINWALTGSTGGTAPVITTQPIGSTVSVGSTANFNIVATGTGLSYRWKKNGSNVTRGTGDTTANYSISGVVGSDSGNFTCVVTNSFGSVTSAIAHLAITPGSLPVIITQPVSITVSTGSTANFNIAATGTGLSYRWKKNGSNVTRGTGDTTSNYSISGVVVSDSGNYTCVVTNAAGSVTSAIARLTITTGSLPVIITQPASVTVTVGSTANFNIVATGTGLSYRWKKNGANVTRGTGDLTPNYSISGTVVSDSGNYTCVVTNASGSVTSSIARLTVSGIVVISNNKKIAINGYLVDSIGNPLGYPTAVLINATIRLMNSKDSGLALYTENFIPANNKGVLVDNGLFVARLGEGATTNNLQQVITSNANLWIEITINEGTPDVLLPRTPLTAAAYSLGGTPAALTNTVIQGNGNPNSSGLEAAVGSTYINTVDNTTWFKLSNGWKALD